MACVRVGVDEIQLGYGTFVCGHQTLYTKDTHTRHGEDQLKKIGNARRTSRRWSFSNSVVEPLFLFTVTLVAIYDEGKIQRYEYCTN